MRVSLVAFGQGVEEPKLDGVAVHAIAADLSAARTRGASIDLTRARALASNADASYSGIQKTGPFELPGDDARARGYGFPSTRPVER